MKVLVIVARDSAHPAATGGDRHISQLAEELAERGDSVTLLAAGHPSLPPREKHGRLTIVRVGSQRLMFPLVWAMELTALHGRFEVVLEEAMGGEHAPFLGRFLSGSPTVGFWYQDNRSLISLLYGRLGSTVGGWVQSLLLRAGRSGYALGNSSSTTDWLIDNGFRRDRVAESFPHVDPSAAPAIPRPFAERRNRIMTIGNIRPTKRFEEAVSVLQRVRRTVPNAELAIMGRAQDGAYLNRLRRLVAESHVDEAVRFYVSASDQEKFSVLSEAKVLTVHSPIEGFGWTVIEAGLCGVPTVGNTGVSADSLRNGTNGVRVGFEDVEAYSRSIVRFFTEPGYWEELSQGARRVALEFASDTLNPAVVELLRRCSA